MAKLGIVPVRARTHQGVARSEDACDRAKSAANHMRMSIPKYNVMYSRLPICWSRCTLYKVVGGRTRQTVFRVVLADVGWNVEDVACLASCKDALGRVVTLAHPKLERLICVFADASDMHWGGIVTQIPHDQVDREFDAQGNEPLIFLILWRGATRAIVEKEAFTIEECLKRADYLLHKPDGFALLTNHANLEFVFNPASVNAAIQKYTAAKLDRWALLLMG
ncbi:hypothetical protein AaE_012961, partial [Aphanomyces astaci]